MSLNLIEQEHSLKLLICNNGVSSREVFIIARTYLHYKITEDNLDRSQLLLIFCCYSISENSWVISEHSRTLTHPLQNLTTLIICIKEYKLLRCWLCNYHCLRFLIGQHGNMRLRSFNKSINRKLHSRNLFVIGIQLIQRIKFSLTYIFFSLKPNKMLFPL